MKWINSNIVFVLAFACYVIASPLPRPNRDGQALIDCKDLFLIRQMKKAGIMFSCMKENKDGEAKTVREEPSANSVFSYGDEEPAKEESIDMAEEELNRLLAAHESTPDGYSNGKPRTRCPEGHIHHAGQCISVKFLTTGYGNHEYRVHGSENGDERCKDGQVFNVEKGKCVKRKNILSIIVDEKDGSVPFSGNGKTLPVVETEEVVSLNKKGETTGSEAEEIVPIDKDEEIIRKLKCEKGFVFVPEEDLCLPVHSGVAPETPKVEAVELAIVPPPEGCPPGSVYSPEIDHCLFVNVNPVQEKTIEEIEALFIKNTKEPSSVIVEEEVIGKAKCGKGTVYSPEIDHCIPVNIKRRAIREVSSKREYPEEKKKTPKGSSYPRNFAIRSLTSADIGGMKCGLGEVYVSEIDLCLAP